MRSVKEALGQWVRGSWKRDGDGDAIARKAMRRKAKQTRKRWQRNITQPAQGRAGIYFFFIRAGKLGQYADSSWREIKLAPPRLEKAARCG
jgi:hypothetical protein